MFHNCYLCIVNVYNQVFSPHAAGIYPFLPKGNFLILFYIHFFRSCLVGLSIRKASVGVMLNTNQEGAIHGQLTLLLIETSFIL